MARARSSSRAGQERERIDAVGTLLTQVRSALFITGPGLTTESGLPHYRGIPGVLRKTPHDGRVIEAALSLEALQRKPKLTWRYLLEIDRQVCAVQPSRA